MVSVIFKPEYKFLKSLLLASPSPEVADEDELEVEEAEEEDGSETLS